MKNLKRKWTAITRTDRVLIALAMLVVSLCAFFLVNDDLLRAFNDEDLSKPLMGVVSYKHNDTRHRSSHSLTWFSAKENQNIRLGDSLFTGENSQSLVVLKEGGEVNMGQNTLVVFNKQSQLLDFGFGNFGFAVNGDVTISIRGEKTRIKGKDSKIQFIVPRNKNEKPRVRLLSGSASLKVKDEPEINLTPERVDSLTIFSNTDYVAEVGLSEEQDPVNEHTLPTRNLRLYDEYELNRKVLTKRVSVDPEIRELPVIEDPVSLSLLKGSSTEAQNFVLRMRGSNRFQGYVVEYSRDSRFPFDQTKVAWVGKNRVEFSLKNPGSVFYRVRGVNGKTEISKLSNVVEAIVPDTQIMIGETESVKPIKKLQKVARVESFKATKSIEPQRVEKIAPTPPTSQGLREDRTVRVVTQTENRSIRKRQVSSVEPNALKSKSSTQIERVAEPTNNLYKNSRLSFETGGFTVFSPDESDVGRTNPYAYMLGVKAKHWLSEKHGLEGIARVKVGDVNETAEGINPLVLEARYHYLLNGSWFSKSNISLLSGLEVYRNIGRGFFAQEYNLGKFGFSLDFPVGNHWDMGGDLVLGLGADSTTKYEALGRLNYYFRKKFSLGGGYRFHILEAGSESAAPFDLPYRETYGEGFLVFRWFY